MVEKFENFTFKSTELQRANGPKGQRSKSKLPTNELFASVKLFNICDIYQYMQTPQRFEKYNMVLRLNEIANKYIILTLNQTTAIYVFSFCYIFTPTSHLVKASPVKYGTRNKLITLHLPCSWLSINSFSVVVISIVFL